jgi:cytochrome oxidase Cu insertion factor (SCO1/SenC/PrrC family)
VKKIAVVLAGLLLIAVGLGMLVAAMQASRPAIEVKQLALNPIKSSAPPARAKKDKLPDWIDEFELTERSGKEFDSRKMAGKVWAASFFFSACPGECALQNKSIAQFQKEFGPQGVTFVSITCDPATDSPERLRTYARDYTDSADQWLFLTGDLDYIRRIGAEYFGVAVNKGTHGSRLILVDKWGNLRGYYSTNGKSNPEEFAAIRPMLKRLLEETEEPAEFKKKSEPKPAEEAEAEDASQDAKTSE